MEPSQSVLIRWQGRIVGPFSLEQLRELTAGGAVTPATEVAPDTGGPWARIETLPLGNVLFPPPPTVTFKVRDYERANRNTSPPITLEDIIAAANKHAPAKPASPVPTSPAPVVASAEHDVNSLLRFNYEIDRRRGHFKLPALLASPSRRRRDYFMLLAGGGALIFAVLVAEAFIGVQVQVLAAQMPDQLWPIFRQVLFHSPLMAFGLAMFSFYVVALGWLMFFVMDRH